MAYTLTNLVQSQYHQPINIFRVRVAFLFQLMCVILNTAGLFEAATLCQKIERLEFNGYLMGNILVNNIAAYTGFRTLRIKNINNKCSTANYIRTRNRHKMR